ncbi:MAG: Crp/Fnr family transcriptional regulator [Bacteroidota bacterium]
MLRTNLSFLSYVEHLYLIQQHKEDIFMKSLGKGKKLLVQDEKASKVILIKSGITKCFFTEENDKEYIVEFLGKGEIVGEIELIRNIPCLCSIEAITDIEVYVISITCFKSLIKKDLDLNNLLLDVFTERIVNTARRASYQQLYTTEYTLAKLLEMQSKHEIKISKEEMAAYLGINIRSLNRAFKTLGRIG